MLTYTKSVTRTPFTPFIGSPTFNFDSYCKPNFSNHDGTKFTTDLAFYAGSTNVAWKPYTEFVYPPVTMSFNNGTELSKVLDPYADIDLCLHECLSMLKQYTDENGRIEITTDSSLCYHNTYNT